MAEHNQSIQPASNWLLKTIQLFFFVSFFLIGLQLWLNPPEKRPEVVCWPTYKLFLIVSVDIPSIITPSDSITPLRNSLKAEKFFSGCRNKAKKLPGFR